MYLVAIPDAGMDSFRAGSMTALTGYAEDHTAIWLYLAGFERECVPRYVPCIINDHHRVPGKYLH